MPNEYVQAIDSIPDLDAFAAVVYSSNYELEIVNDASGLSHTEGDEGQTPAPAASSTKQGTGKQSGEGQKSKDQSEKRTSGGSRPGISDQAAGLFENVWEKVVG